MYFAFGFLAGVIFQMLLMAVNFIHNSTEDFENTVIELRKLRNEIDNSENF